MTTADEAVRRSPADTRSHTGIHRNTLTPAEAVWLIGLAANRC
jgi:hypothetical protein